jgi:hypothetical protein
MWPTFLQRDYQVFLLMLLHFMIWLKCAENYKDIYGHLAVHEENQNEWFPGNSDIKWKVYRSFKAVHTRSVFYAACHIFSVVTARVWVKLRSVQSNLSDWIRFVGFEVLTAVSTKMAVFWVVAPCSLVEVYHRFRGSCCHSSPWWWRQQGPLKRW